MKEINTLKVKQCFLVGKTAKQPRRGEKRYLGDVPLEEFNERLAWAKRKVLAMTQRALDRKISSEYERRLRAFDACDWYVTTVRPSEVGVWRSAGGLPRAWTEGALKETAAHVKKALASNSRFLRYRARRAIPSLLAGPVGHLQSEPYLLPIVFQHRAGTNGRRGLPKKLKGDIDDGCMRSIALTINGAKQIKVYFGIPKLPDTRPK